MAYDSTETIGEIPPASNRGHVRERTTQESQKMSQEWLGGGP